MTPSTPEATDRRVDAWAELGLDAAAFLLLPVLALASRGAVLVEALAGILALVLVLPRGLAAWRLSLIHI